MWGADLSWLLEEKNVENEIVVNCSLVGHIYSGKTDVP